MLKIQCLTVLAVLCLTATPLLASTEQLPIIPERPQVTPSLPQKQEPTIHPPLSPTSPEVSSFHKTIKVERFIFKGNTAIKTSQLETVLAPYLGKQITISELRGLVNAITLFYQNQGYITSKALMPIEENQNINPNAAVVTIQILEGKLEKVDILGDIRLRNYVRLRLPSVGAVVNKERLLEALRLLQNDPLVESIIGELNQGSQPDKAIFRVTVVEREPFSFVAGLNNSRSPALGSFERKLELTNANLLGLGDKLSISYRNTDGSNSWLARYSVPINAHNGTIELSYLDSSASIIERPFNDLDILSDARAYSVSFRQPLIKKATAKSIQEFALGLSFSRLESESSLLGTPYPLADGADNEGRTRISALRFSQDWIKRTTRGSLLLRSQFSLGIDAFDTTSTFFAWRGQAGLLRDFTSDATLVTRAELQLADRPLAALEQIGLGGADSVRGYREATFFTDNAFLVSTELRLQAWSKDNQRLYVIPFFDIGTAWNNNDANITSTQTTGTLASVGLGLQYQLSDRLNARLDWGIPLIKVDTNAEVKTWQENGVYFSIDYRLF